MFPMQAIHNTKQGKYVVTINCRVMNLKESTEFHDLNLARDYAKKMAVALKGMDASVWLHRVEIETLEGWIV